MIFIDAHCHVYPEPIARKATQSVCDFYGLVTPYIGTVEEKTALDKSLGIDKSVILPVAVKPKQIDGIHRFIVTAAKENPSLIPFATAHAEDEELAERASHYIEQGFYGVKMHPDMQLFNIDDERLFPLYDMLQGRLPVMFHSGDPRHPYSHPSRIKRIMEEFPKLQVIAAHLGGWHSQELAVSLLKDKENCFVDTSSSISEMPPELVLKYINAFGTDRVLFGTDYPVDNPVTQKEYILSLPLPQQDIEKIAHKNAEALLGIHA